MKADVASPRRKRIRFLKAFIVVAFLAALVFSVRSQWGAVRHDFSRLPVIDLVLALVLAVLATAGSMLAWRAMLADLGSPLGLSPAVRVYALSQLGKYIPGSVWPVLAQMELGRAFNVPRLRSATAFLLILLSSLLTAVAAGGLLAFSSPGWGRATALLPLTLLLLHPRVLVPITALLGRVLRRPAIADPPTLRGVVRCIGWQLTQWFCLGLATELMASGLGASVSLGRCIAAVALSWAAGLVVIPVPAGAGIREAVLVFLLSPAVGSGLALTLALLGRLTLTAADAFAAGVGALAGRAARRRLLEIEALATADEGTSAMREGDGPQPCSQD